MFLEKEDRSTLNTVVHLHASKSLKHVQNYFVYINLKVWSISLND